MEIVVAFLSLISLVVWYLSYKDPVLSIIFIILGSWIILSSIYEIFQFVQTKKKIPNKIFAQVLAHIGIGLLIIGATGGSKLYKPDWQLFNKGK